VATGGSGGDGGDGGDGGSGGDLLYNKVAGKVGEVRIFSEPTTWKQARLGEGACRHVFLGCDGPNELTVLKRQCHSWDLETGKTKLRGGCNSNGTLKRNVAS